MASDPMTASALHALVSRWPREARSDKMYYSPSRSGEIDFFYLSDQQNYAGPCILPTAHAIALHEASGLRWLEGMSMEGIGIKRQLHENSVMLWTVSFSIGWDGRYERAETLIEALHAAIMATAKESHP